MTIVSGIGVSLPTLTIPGLGLDIVGLLSASANDLIAQIKSLYSSYGDFSFFGPLAIYIPSPIFSGLSIPDYEVDLALQNVIRGFTSEIYMQLFGTISTITSILEISGPSFTMVALPSAADLLSMLPSAPTLADLKALAAVGIPGFPGVSLSDLPDPLFVGLSIPEVELQEGMKTLQYNCSAYSINLFSGWISDIGFTLPSIESCFPISIG